MAQTIDERLAELGITLPKASAPGGSYVPVVQSGPLLFVSGQVPMGPDGIEYVGRCGDTISLEDAQAAARLCALNILAQAKAHLGDLEKIVRIVKLTGFVHASPEFGDQPKVMNGASELLVDVLGERGRHARSAVGMSGLPFGVSVEVEAIIEVA